MKVKVVSIHGWLRQADRGVETCGRNELSEAAVADYPDGSFELSQASHVGTLTDRYQHSASRKIMLIE
jgi:hypothetical protein